MTMCGIRCALIQDSRTCFAVLVCRSRLRRTCLLPGNFVPEVQRMASRSISIICIASILLCLAGRASSQTQTTGRIAGTAKDAQGAVIIGAQVSIENPATADKHSVTTDTSGNYSILHLPPGAYDVRISAPGCTPTVFHAVKLGLAERGT